MKKLFLFIILTWNVLYTMAQAPTIQWQTSIGGTGQDDGNSIKQTIDGGYIVAGQSTSIDGDVTGNHGGADCWVVKLTNLGVIQWQKSFGGSNTDVGFSIQQTTDLGYIIAGTSASNDGDVTGNHGGGGDAWIIKIDSVGTLQWQKCFGGTSAEEANSIFQTSDGGFIVSAETYSNNGDVIGNHGGQDSWIIKIDSLGNIQWEKCYGGTGSDRSKSIQQTADGGFIFAGYSNSLDGDVSGNHGSFDSWIVKLDNSGILQWQNSLGGTNNDDALSIQQTTDGGYIMGGISLSNNGDVPGGAGGQDYFIVKLNNLGIKQWAKSIGGSYDEAGSYVRQTSDGGFVIGGTTSSTAYPITGNHGSADDWIVKTNSMGIMQWQKCLGGSLLEGAGEIIQSADGGFVIAGESLSYDGDITSHHGGDDTWIVKLNPLTGIIEDSEKSVQISISPNPTNGSFNLFITDRIINGSAEVYNSLGELVLNEKIINQQNAIDLSNQADGLYFVKVISDNIIVGTKKIVKQ